MARTGKLSKMCESAGMSRVRGSISGFNEDFDGRLVERWRRQIIQLKKQ